MVTGAAGNEDEPPASADGAHVLFKTTEGDSSVGHVQPTTHGVDDRLRLLKDLLLHEVIELALHNLLELKLDRLDCANIASAVVLCQSVDVELTVVDVSNIVVFEVEELLGVLDEG